MGEEIRGLRLLVAAPVPLWRLGLRAALEDTAIASFTAEAACARESLALDKTLRPDVAVIDTRLADGSGLEACRQLVNTRPGRPVLVVSESNADCLLAAAWKAGATGFLTRDMPVAALASAIRLAVEGGYCYTGEQIQRVRAWERTIGERLARLTPREWAVLLAVQAGCGLKQAAAQSGVTVRTVQRHVQALIDKLEVGDVAELARVVAGETIAPVYLRPAVKRSQP